MSKEAPKASPSDFDPEELLLAAHYLKEEGEDVSDALRGLEGRILECVNGDMVFEEQISQALLPEVGAEIFDTLLSDYLKWYKCSTIAVRMPAERDHLSFAGYVQIEKPLRLGLGVAYEMQDLGREEPGPAGKVHTIEVIPGSVRMRVDAAFSVRAAVAAMKIEKSIAHMLADPASIVRKTLECRFRTAYNFREPLGAVGLSIADGIVNVVIHPANHR